MNNKLAFHSRYATAHLVVCTLTRITHDDRLSLYIQSVGMATASTLTSKRASGMLPTCSWLASDVLFVLFDLRYGRRAAEAEASPIRLINKAQQSARQKPAQHQQFGRKPGGVHGHPA